MGRYKSAQYFPDSATAKVKVDGVAEAHGGSSGSASVTGNAVQRAPPPQPEKVERAVGSTAGAASSEFHLYRAARRRELTRVELLEKTALEEKEAAEFASKVEANKKEAEERTLKNANKRKKRKLKSRNGGNGSDPLETCNKIAKNNNGNGKKIVPTISLDDFSDSENDSSNEADKTNCSEVAPDGGVDDATLVRLLLKKE
jgi:hypothetical protein